MKIDIFSFNTRGLNDEKKRRGVFKWIKSLYKGIVLLQETHSTRVDEKNG